MDFTIAKLTLIGLHFDSQITIKFQVPHGCEVPQLIANLVSNLGLKVEEHGGGSDMSLRAWDRLIQTIISFKFTMSIWGLWTMIMKKKIFSKLV